MPPRGDRRPTGTPALGRARPAAGGPTHPGGATRILDLAESGPSRLRFPRGTGALETVLVNTAGGVACGDTFAIDLALDPGAELVLTTTAAEKIYRSDGPVSHIANTLALEAGAHLPSQPTIPSPAPPRRLPQATILFDRAPGAPPIHGRSREGARDRVEVVASPSGQGLSGSRTGCSRIPGAFAGRPARLRRRSLLDGPISDLLARPAVGGGERAPARNPRHRPRAEARLEEAPRPPGRGRRTRNSGARVPGTVTWRSAPSGRPSARCAASSPGSWRSIAASRCPGSAKLTGTATSAAQDRCLRRGRPLLETRTRSCPPSSGRMATPFRKASWRVVSQRTANPCTPVRFRARPPSFLFLSWLIPP